MKRYLEEAVHRDLEKKIVLLGGPRQVGKTTLAKSFFSTQHEYLNFDSEAHRRLIQSQSWNRKAPLVIFDELHKMKAWKKWLKGIYDVESIPPQILVTGSSRLDTFRKTGDSLAGRHFYLRLHPLSVREVDPQKPLDVVNQFLELGCFPEPFLNGSLSHSRRWRKNHIDRILREDLLDLEEVRQLKQIEILVQLLSQRVGAPVSYSSLARDLEISPHTVKRWIEILENLFVVFTVRPYSQKLNKTLRKEPKIYFYDLGRIPSDMPAARLENLVASHLLKRAHFLSDVEGEECDLYYIRDKEKREVDFLTTREQKIEWLVEVKTSDKNISPHLKYFEERLHPERSLQVVKDLKKALSSPTLRSKHFTEINPVSDFLASLEV